MTSIRDIVRAIDNKYSLKRAEKWDKVGLLIGDPNAVAHRVLVAHEVTDATIDEAQNSGANCLVVYHPPLFRPLENLDFSDHSVRLAARCIATNIAVIAVHTALDNAPLGKALGDKLAAQLGLSNVRVLKANGRESLCKLVVYLPDSDLQNVQNALWQTGAGNIGNYDEASFRISGKGTFRAQAGANPTIGQMGKREEVDEWCLEVIVPQNKIDDCVRAMKAAHSYEEVAYDILLLQNSGEPFGAARIGELESSIRFEDFARKVQQTLNVPGLRLVRSGKTKVKKVACVPGSGASYLNAVAQHGADVLVTGDIKHHDALQAQAHNVAIIDTTHTATEHAAIEMIAQVLETSREKLGIEVVRSFIDTNPFKED